jgi:hypothetical protein
LQATSRGMVFVSIGPLHGLDYRPATCRRPDQVFCIFRCSDASGAPATIPIAELLACCETAAQRNAFAVGKVSPVTCPRTTDFHSAQAIAEDLGTFAPSVFVFLGSKILDIFTRSGPRFGSDRQTFRASKRLMHCSKPCRRIETMHDHDGSAFSPAGMDGGVGRASMGS